jgi:polysaccharide export outer membrane protein
MDFKKLYFSLAILLTSCTSTHLPIEGKQRISTAHNDVPKRVRIFTLNPMLVAKMKQPTPSPHSNASLKAQIERYQYRIGKGDVLSIIVWDHPEITTPAGQYRSSVESGNEVRADGSIYYPYIGSVYVSGKTIPEVRDEVSMRLAKYIEKPQVEVKVAAFRSQRVYITGEVGTKGEQPITNVPLTVLDAINKAGGVSDKVDWQNVSLIHDNHEHKLSLYALMQHGDLTQNKLLRNGDILYVPNDEDRKVFVMGEVSNQVIKMARTGMSLTEAVSQVGGTSNINVDATGIFVIRAIPSNLGKPKSLLANIYQLNLRDATSAILGTEFALQPYDIVYITATPIARWNRVVAQLMPTIAAVNAFRSEALLITGNNS